MLCYVCRNIEKQVNSKLGRNIACQAGIYLPGLEYGSPGRNKVKQGRINAYPAGPVGVLPRLGRDKFPRLGQLPRAPANSSRPACPGWAGAPPGGPPRPLPRLGQRALSGRRHLPRLGRDFAPRMGRSCQPPAGLPDLLPRLGRITRIRPGRDLPARLISFVSRLGQAGIPLAQAGILLSRPGFFLLGRITTLEAGFHLSWARFIPSGT
jgi:hypothetical protein